MPSNDVLYEIPVLLNSRDCIMFKHLILVGSFMTGSVAHANTVVLDPVTNLTASFSEGTASLLCYQTASCYTLRTDYAPDPGTHTLSLNLHSGDQFNGTLSVLQNMVSVVGDAPLEIAVSRTSYTTVFSVVDVASNATLLSQTVWGDEGIGGGNQFKLQASFDLSPFVGLHDLRVDMTTTFKPGTYLSTSSDPDCESILCMPSHKYVSSFISSTTVTATPVDEPSPMALMAGASLILASLTRYRKVWTD